MTDNVIEFNKYRPDLTKLVQEMDEDNVEDIVIEYLQSAIQVLVDNDINPYDDGVGNEMVAISMLFRAMLDRQFGRENHLQTMLDVMTRDMKTTGEE
tara:strand:- start:2341 stop:2631 length:291 start_codon:yes stop_codon:yes gene_type:complete